MPKNSTAITDADRAAAVRNRAVALADKGGRTREFREAERMFAAGGSGYIRWSCALCGALVDDGGGWVYWNGTDDGRQRWVAIHSACREYVTTDSVRVSDMRYAADVYLWQHWFETHIWLTLAEAHADRSSHKSST